jgi:hypothetical protein
MSDAAQEFRGNADPDQDVRLALSAIAAIQRLVEERNALRSQLAAEERELARLRRSLSNIRETYRKLTCDFVRQMQNIDGMIGDIPRAADPANAAAPTAQSEVAEAPSPSSDRFGY